MKYSRPEIKISVFDVEKIMTLSISGSDQTSKDVFKAAGQNVDAAASQDIGSIFAKTE